MPSTPQEKKFHLFQKDGQKHKMVIKIEFTPLSDCNILSFFKGLKKSNCTLCSYVICRLSNLSAAAFDRQGTSLHAMLHQPLGKPFYKQLLARLTLFQSIVHSSLQIQDVMIEVVKKRYHLTT